MLIYEYKLDGNTAQYVAIDEAIRVTQFIRNKCLRLWMDERGVSKNDLQCYCAQLAKEYPFAACLNSQARQASADRAWVAIARFYDNCKEKRAHICHGCGVVLDRDHNAALNILTKALGCTVGHTETDGLAP